MKLNTYEKTFGILFAVGLQIACFFIVLQTPSLPVSLAALCGLVFGAAILVSFIFNEEIK